ncbi:putative TOS1-like glycosyl hydrolase-domain-containing protein [Daedaleopsis nitida]|nr:putative TOS1-like glycosyl hydrolase-domain-containing protein [Daedaleopsis nitida]
MFTLALLAISSYAPTVTARSRCLIASPSAAASPPVAQTSALIPASSSAAQASASGPVSSLAAHNVVGPANLVSASTSGALSALKYTNVGSTGTYDQVTNIIPGTFPTCNANPFCVTQPKTISGNLAPFDDEMTVAFRGPMNIYNIAVYQPANGTSASWSKVSSWAADQQPDNLVFMNNNGGDKSGEWSICAGSSQSYANGDWTDATTAPNKELAKGSLPEGHEINIMTAESCTSAPCAGFARGTANHGWAGSKFFVFTFDMPSAASPASTPAIWALNAQIVRAAQYGCNCRGVGPKGCGELDIVETLPASSVDADANPARGISEIYSPKGATGSGASFFARPADAGERATFGVIFDVETDSIAIQRYTGWDYTVGAVEKSAVDGYLGAEAKVVDFGGSGEGKKRRSAVHKRRQHWH